MPNPRPAAGRHFDLAATLGLLGMFGIPIRIAIDTTGFRFRRRHLLASIRDGLRRTAVVGNACPLAK
jgi:hypothetical protein